MVTTRQTTEAGVYVLSPLAPGTYRVSVTLMGFETVVREGVVVDALAVVGLNLTLPVAGVKQEVVVTGETPQLATADARLGQTIRNEVYTALPLVMNTGGPRDPTAFMFLMPGVQSVGRWGNVMGGQDFTNDTYVDGIPITNAVVQGEGRNLSFGISVESIEQFQVETSGTAVMYNGQGASNYVVKSGTNQFRGSVFEYFRNKALDSKAFFASAKPDDNQHEFGFTAGGPIRRSRMFFFSAYDGYRDRRQTEQRLVSVPTLAQRRGDFSALPVTIYDPRTTRPNPAGTGLHPRSLPGQRDPAGAALADLAVLPVVPAGPDQRRSAEQLPGRKPADRVRQRQRHGEGRPHDDLPAAGLADGRARPPRAVHRLPRRRQRPDGAAPALHGDAPGRGGSHDRATQAHLCARRTLGEPGELRLLTAVGADLQCDHRRALSHRGGTDRTAARRSRFVIPRGELRRAERPHAVARHRRQGLHRVPRITTPFQNNLNWTHGKHAMTFGFQGQRMDANERERAYGSVATFGFSNAQTAGFGPTGTLQTATGHAYASFLLGDLNATNVTEDSEVATSGRFYTYGFWVQDDYRVTPDLTLNLGLRYDIMKPYTEVYDRWSFMNPDLPNPAVGGYPGAIQFAGTGENSCNCRTPIETYHGAVGPRIGSAYSVNERLVLRAAYGINYSRRGAVGGRAGARNGTGMLGFSASPSFPSPNTFDPAYNWNNGVPAYPDPPFFDPSLNAGFVVGRGSGGGVTYGDPEIGGRPPRYQNWNAGVQFALAAKLTVSATYAGSVGDFLGGSGRGFFANQLDPKYLALGNLLTQPANAANIAAAQAIVQGVALPYPNFSGTIAQMLRPFPQYSGVTDVYGNVASSRYHSMQLTAEKRRGDDGLTVNVNYTFSRTEDNLAARTGWDFAQDWAVGINDQPHIFNAMVVYDLPFGAEGRAGSGNSVIRAIVRGWQLSGITQFRSGRPLGSIGAACNLPSAGTCYADFNPDFSGPVRINGDYGDGDVLGSAPPAYIDRAAFVSPPPFTYGNTPRTLAHDLRNPNYFNQDLSIRRDFLIRRVKLVAGLDVFNVFNTVVFGGINTNITSTAFGRVSSQVNTPRVAQLKARLEF